MLCRAIVDSIFVEGKTIFNLSIYGYVTSLLNAYTWDIRSFCSATLA